MTTADRTSTALLLWTPEDGRLLRKERMVHSTASNEDVGAILELKRRLDLVTESETAEACSGSAAVVDTRNQAVESGQDALDGARRRGAQAVGNTIDLLVKALDAGATGPPARAMPPAGSWVGSPEKLIAGK